MWKQPVQTSAETNKIEKNKEPVIHPDENAVIVGNKCSI